MRIQVTRLLQVFLCFFPALQGNSQTIHLSGYYELFIPPDGRTLNVEFYKSESSAGKGIQQFFKKGKYIIKNQGTTYYFQIDTNKNFVGDILILGNYYGTDSTIITQEKSMFKSVKQFIRNKLIIEKTYLGDSVFSYKHFFSDGSYYIGKSRLYHYGIFNVEHNEYDSLNKPVEKSFKKGDTLFKQGYKSGELALEKRICQQPEFLYYSNGKLDKREIYQKKDDQDYFRFVYNAEGELIKEKELVKKEEIFGKTYQIISH
jgi:uncharacterized protein YegP (UPF0339 family)